MEVPKSLFHPRTWKWLESTKKLQEGIYGYPLDDFSTLVKTQDNPIFDNDLRAVAKYLDWNATAAVQELAELREEFSWKPWATDRPFVNRERILKEAVDVGHFIGNILTGIGVTDEEYEEAYRNKQQINILRAQSGTYSAKKGGISQGSD